MRRGSIHNATEMVDLIQEVGFLPLLYSGISGFSAEEVVDSDCRYVVYSDGGWDWPMWKWKGPIVTEGNCVYGKFFRGRAGFIRRDWFPVFANFRRKGYDFDALYDDGFAPNADKQLYDTLAQRGTLLSRELKTLAGYGRGGEKGFETRITRLQMQCYVVIADFEYMKDKFGKEYGWGVARYAVPEALFGADLMKDAYREEPDASRARVYAHLQMLCPEASERQLKRLLGDP